VVTNLEFDHTDYFKDLADVQDAFRTLMLKVPANGAIVTDSEHPNIQPLLTDVQARVIDYRTEPAYELRLPGGFNQMNARAAAAAARILEPAITDSQIRESLSEFHGTWRRFEYKGKTATGADVYDDYAHHPTAVQETLRALRAKVGDSRIIVSFHPHLYSRTRDLLDGFARSFGDADEVIIAPIYAAREVDDGSVSSTLLAERITKEGTNARAADSLEEVGRLLNSYKEGDTIMTMGAGDIYKVADDLVKR
jgi:UDP-N-acetylmuramate--alanine ligase